MNNFFVVFFAWIFLFALIAVLFYWYRKGDGENDEYKKRANRIADMQLRQIHFEDEYYERKTVELQKNGEVYTGLATRGACQPRKYGNASAKKWMEQQKKKKMEQAELY